MNEMVRHKPTAECLITQLHPAESCPFIQARHRRASEMTATAGKISPGERGRSLTGGGPGDIVHT